MEFARGRPLPVCEVTAHNYAADVENKIHSDEGAAEHGFAGALVPGVGMYAYLTRPATAALGREWLARGSATAKFVRPVHHGDRVRAQAVVSETDPLALQLELTKADGTTCAVGSAGLPATLPALDPAGYPAAAQGAPRPPTIDGLREGEIFGTLEFRLDLAGAVAAFARDVVEEDPLYRGVDAVCHPAYWLAQANEVFMRNIALGMWIHTASEIQHLALARDGESVSLRSRVARVFERRGHESLQLDIGVFGEADRPLARILHTAIIRLREL